MDIKEYNAQNMGKQVLVLQEKEIKSLMHFSTIAKNESINGLIVSGSYVGFTDTYRLAVVRDTREELPGSDTKIYSVSVLEELKKAKSMAVLKNGKLAIQVGSEVTEYEPVNRERVPDIKVFIEGYEYGSHTKARSLNKITDDLVWKMLKLTKFDTRKYFIFKDNKVRVEAYPNEKSTLILDDLFEYNKDNLDIKFNLNVKYIDLWLKYIKNEFFNISLSTSNNAIKFSNCNVVYVVMPMMIL